MTSSTAFTITAAIVIGIRRLPSPAKLSGETTIGLMPERNTRGANALRTSADAENFDPETRGADDGSAHTMRTATTPT